MSNLVSNHVLLAKLLIIDGKHIYAEKTPKTLMFSTPSVFVRLKCERGTAWNVTSQRCEWTTNCNDA